MRNDSKSVLCLVVHSSSHSNINALLQIPVSFTLGTLNSNHCHHSTFHTCVCLPSIYAALTRHLDTKTKSLACMVDGSAIRNEHLTKAQDCKWDTTDL